MHWHPSLTALACVLIWQFLKFIGQVMDSELTLTDGTKWIGGDDVINWSESMYMTRHQNIAG